MEEFFERENIDPATQQRLRAFHFEEIPFESLCAKTRENRFQTKLESASISPIDAELLIDCRNPNDALIHAGEEALRKSKVGVVILAGGMATRFGGVVKANVPVDGEQTFLDLKLADIEKVAERFECTIPVFLMSSFQSDAALREAVESRGMHPRVPVEVFPQFVSLRVDEDGQLFRDENGSPSLHAPGHGDLHFAMNKHGIIDRCLAQNITIVAMSNVDNLAATLSRQIIGAHMAGNVSMSVETVSKNPGDKGGAPAMVDGVPQIVEGFRFPDDFDQDTIGVFNTNTLVFTTAALKDDTPLDFFPVKKQVGGQDVIQFERLVGQLSAHLACQFLHVSREGDTSRFSPIKTKEDLVRYQNELEASRT